MGVLLTPRQVADRLAVSTRTVYSWIDSGRLPAVRFSERVTRIPEEVVDQLVAQATTRATARPPLPRGAVLGAEAPATYVAVEPAVPEPLPADRRTPSQRLRELLETHRDEIIRIVQENRADNVRVFGSVARGDAREDSDIDLLIDPQPGMTLFNLGGIDWRLEELLGVGVDVVPARSLRQRIRDRVLAESLPL